MSFSFETIISCDFLDHFKNLNVTKLSNEEIYLIANNNSEEIFEYSVNNNLINAVTEKFVLDLADYDEPSSIFKIIFENGLLLTECDWDVESELFQKLLEKDCIAAIEAIYNIEPFNLESLLDWVIKDLSEKNCSRVLTFFIEKGLLEANNEDSEFLVDAIYNENEEFAKFLLNRFSKNDVNQYVIDAIFDSENTDYLVLLEKHLTDEMLLSSFKSAINCSDNVPEFYYNTNILDLVDNKIFEQSFASDKYDFVKFVSLSKSINISHNYNNFIDFVIWENDIESFNRAFNNDGFDTYYVGQRLIQNAIEQENYHIFSTLFPIYLDNKKYDDDLPQELWELLLCSVQQDNTDILSRLIKETYISETLKDKDFLIEVWNYSLRSISSFKFLVESGYTDDIIEEDLFDLVLNSCCIDKFNILLNSDNFTFKIENFHNFCSVSELNHRMDFVNEVLKQDILKTENLDNEITIAALCKNWKLFFKLYEFENVNINEYDIDKIFNAACFTNEEVVNRIYSLKEFNNNLNLQHFIEKVSNDYFYSKLSVVKTLSELKWYKDFDLTLPTFLIAKSYSSGCFNDKYYFEVFESFVKDKRTKLFYDPKEYDAEFCTLRYLATKGDSFYKLFEIAYNEVEKTEEMISEISLLSLHSNSNKLIELMLNDIKSTDVAIYSHFIIELLKNKNMDLNLLFEIFDIKKFNLNYAFDFLNIGSSIKTVRFEKLYQELLSASEHTINENEANRLFLQVLSHSNWHLLYILHNSSLNIDYTSNNESILIAFRTSFRAINNVNERLIIDILSNTNFKDKNKLDPLFNRVLQKIDDSESFGYEVCKLLCSNLDYKKHLIENHKEMYGDFIKTYKKSNILSF